MAPGFPRFPSTSSLLALLRALPGLVFINGASSIHQLLKAARERMLRACASSFTIAAALPIASSRSHPASSSDGDLESSSSAASSAMRSAAVFQGGQLLTTIFFMFIQIRAGLAASRSTRPGLSHPEAAAQGEPARQAPVRQIRQVATASARAPPGAEIHTNDAVRLQLRRLRQMMGRSTTSLRGLSAQVLRQVPQQFLGQLTPSSSMRSAGISSSRQPLLRRLVAVLAAYKDLAGPWNDS